MAISALGVLVLCFFANASVLLPSSSILIVVECSMLMNPFLAALCGAFGAALGEMIAFYVGIHGERAVPGRFMNWVKVRITSHKYLMLLLFSMLPFPVFDIIGLLSGAMKMNALKFFGVCFTGKLIKVLCYVWLAHELLPLLE